MKTPRPSALSIRRVHSPQKTKSCYHCLGLPIPKKPPRVCGYCQDQFQSNYHTPRWKKVRKIVLRSSAICAHCNNMGIVKLATDVDHIKNWREYPDLFWDLENLQSLCHSCHSIKTAREDRGLEN